MSNDSLFLFKLKESTDSELESFLNGIKRELSNALTYDPSELTLEVVKDVGGVVIEVSDEYPLDKIKHVLERSVESGKITYLKLNEDTGKPVGDEMVLSVLDGSHDFKKPELPSTPKDEDMSSSFDNEKSSVQSEHKPTTYEPSSNELPSDSVEIIDELLPNIDDIVRELSPSLDVKYGGVNVPPQQRMNEVMLSNSLRTMYNVNREDISDVKNNTDGLKAALDALKDELNSDPTEQVQKYNNSIQQLRQYEDDILSQKKAIKQQYIDEMERHIESEVEKLKAEYRERYPDKTDEKIQELIQSSEPTIQAFKRNILNDRVSAQEEIFNKLLDASPDSKSLVNALSYLEEKKRIESELDDMNRLLEEERQNMIAEKEAHEKREREAREAQQQELERERQERKEREAQLERERERQENEEKSQERTEDMVDYDRMSDDIAQAVIAQLDRIGTLESINKFANAQEVEPEADITPPIADENLDAVAERSNELMENANVEGYDDIDENIEPTTEGDNLVSNQSGGDMDALFGELGLNDYEDEDEDDELEQEQPQESQEQPQAEQSSTQSQQQQPERQPEETQQEVQENERPEDESNAGTSDEELTETEERNRENVGVSNVDELNDTYQEDNDEVDDLIDSFNTSAGDDDVYEDDAPNNNTDGLSIDEMDDLGKDLEMQNSLVDDDIKWESQEDGDFSDLEDVEGDDEVDLSSMSKRERKKYEKQKKKEEKRLAKEEKARRKREEKEVKRKPDKNDYNDSEGKSSSLGKKLLIGLVVFVAVIILSGIVFGTVALLTSDNEQETPQETEQVESSDDEVTEDVDNEETPDSEETDDASSEDDDGESKKKVKPIAKVGEVYRIEGSDSEYSVTEVNEDGSAVLKNADGDVLELPHEEFEAYEEKEKQREEERKEREKDEK